MSVWEWLEWERKCSETVVALSTGAAFYFYELTHFLDWINEDHFTFRLQYKHSTFANRKYEEQAYPKNPNMCDPILVTPLKMRQYPHSRGLGS